MQVLAGSSNLGKQKSIEAKELQLNKKFKRKINNSLKSEINKKIQVVVLWQKV